MRPIGLNPAANTAADADTEAGLTLIEVLVAILVLSIGIVAAFRTFEAVTGHAQQATDRILAQQIVLNDLAEIRSVGLSALGDRPATVSMGNREFLLSRTASETAAGYIELRVQARREDGIATSVTGFFAQPQDDR